MSFALKSNFVPEKADRHRREISGAASEHLRCPQISSHEQRLSGHWVYQEFYSSGRGKLHMMLLHNGHYLRTSNSVASLILYDSAGNWAGIMERASAVDPGDHGKWRFDGRLLTLEIDDDSTYEYTVTLSGTSMTTRNTTGGAQRLWTKER
jgi:hypothetical protein